MELIFKKRNLLLILSVFLSACLVGPNFRPATPPPTDRYTEKPIPSKTVTAPSAGGNSQQLIYGRDIPGDWWRLFHSPCLNELIIKGIEHSPNLAAAQAALQAAEYNLRAAEGQLFPKITANASVTRQRQPGALVGAPGAPSITYTLYNVAFNVSYVFDLWGGVRRQIEGYGAQVDYQYYQEQAAYLTLTANIVTTAITEASLRAQIATTMELIKEQRNILYIVEQQYRLGAASGGDVLIQQTQLAQIEATLPPLRKNLAQNRDALAALVGDVPSLSPLPKFYLSDITLPGAIPVSLPSELIRQRPDILASEALLHYASTQIGVATANLLPQLTLSAAYGWAGTSLNTLFTTASSYWNIAASVMQPIFEGGALIAKKAAAEAAYQQALAQYQQTVLQAFQNVADALQALEIDAQTLKAAAAAENSARGSYILTGKQYHLGATNYLNLLNAQLQYQQTSIARVKAQAARYADTAALFQALGGGWWQVVVPPGINHGAIYDKYFPQ
ncbi:MAG: efflux transporter outer membrane subunit [Proteobacteria bacterium]|nr:efflux transporter outer membrane subunit [Pseudomonadota bacterium]